MSTGMNFGRAELRRKASHQQRDRITAKAVESIMTPRLVLVPKKKPKVLSTAEVLRRLKERK